MPGPGAHTMYTLATGTALGRLTMGRFSPQHSLFYSINGFLGPDLGSLAEWISSFSSSSSVFGSAVMDLIHHPFYYPLILGFPLSFFYSSLSTFLLSRGFLDTLNSGLPLTKRQCFSLIAAGSFSHFFLDHLFEENGRSSTYRWILSTGWWNGRAPIEPDSVFVIGLLCSALFGGFIYINRMKRGGGGGGGGGESIITKSNKSLKLILLVAFLYCMWCASQIYWRNPPKPAIGEEADLGVIIFLLIYVFLHHSLCILSMNSKEEKVNVDSDDKHLLSL